MRSQIATMSGRDALQNATSECEENLPAVELLRRPAKMETGTVITTNGFRWARRLHDGLNVRAVFVTTAWLRHFRREVTHEYLRSISGA